MGTSYLLSYTVGCFIVLFVSLVSFDVVFIIELSSEGSGSLGSSGVIGIYGSLTFSVSFMSVYYKQNF